MTRAQEGTQVGEALAVGCLVAGISAVAQVSVETAFRRAWRDWPGARSYSTIHADFARNDIVSILYKSETRQVPHIASWSDSERGWWTPYLTVDWDLQNAVEHINQCSEVSWTSWEALTKTFLEYFKDFELRREAD